MGAVTITLVKSGHNHLRYLLASATTGTDTGTITTTGAVTPDVLTDLAANQGPLMQIAKAFTLGYGQLAAGALSQAQARALWLADNTGANVSISGNRQIPLARCQIQDASGGGLWYVDANVDGSGHPTIAVGSVGAVGTAYLDINSPGTIGI